MYSDETKNNHTLSLVARTKADLAYKENIIEGKIKLLESMILPDVKSGTIILGVKEIVKDEDEVL